MSFFSEALWVLLLGSLLGLELIGKVPPTLHTPLMSGANAISGITMLAALTLMVLSIYFWKKGRNILPLLLPMLFIMVITGIDVCSWWCNNI